jgi:3-oxoacid CoA-transferase subunit B
MISNLARLTRNQIAARVAAELQDGWFVNVGVGMPTLVANYVPPHVEIFIHSENGLLGVGPAPLPEEADPDLVNASREQVTLRPGACFFNHAESFGMIRGGHIDVTILGAFQVSERGDLANWLLPGANIGNPGGAVDLAVGAKRVFAMFEHTARDGALKVVRECTYPLTGRQCVTTLFTDLAVIDVTAAGLVLREVAPGWTPEAVQAVTEPILHQPCPPTVIQLSDG